MTTRRRGRSTRGRSRSNARYQWFQRQNADLTTIVAGGTALVNLLSSISAEANLGITVVRMLLRLTVSAAAAQAVTQFGHGVIIVTRDAFAAGALPEPATDEQQWYLNDGDQVEFSTGGSEWKDYTYDIRSARRIRSANSLPIHVMENTDSAESLRYNIFSNLLVRLH